ncbi:Rad4-domain-containing protein [Trichodelitschia bisporula]|uniref:Rad4-domain-containing protein n=1 Tax=Trichodelitschia bisporula TaxID=703511 RepID=A0A6G1HSA9_9PEZI|nr:Rad4-domain-containing protein [Trichodelitschia bisporula]
MPPRSKSHTPKRNPASTRSIKRGGDPDVPDVYKDLLKETGNANREAEDEVHPVKKRKVSAPVPLRGRPSSSSSARPPEVGFRGQLDTPREPSPEARLQTIEDDEDSDEEEFEWEEVDLSLPQPAANVAESSSKPLQIVIDRNLKSQKQKGRMKKRPPSSAEKIMRLNIHKLHILCLLYHCFCRNNLCNDTETQAILKRLVNPRIVNSLQPPPNASQLQRSRIFTEGLTQVVGLWHAVFKITAIGLRRPAWAQSLGVFNNFRLPKLVENPIKLADFRTAARKREGSADLGAQLLCCLFRAVGVEARVVCSLQPLSFSAVGQTAILGQSPAGDGKDMKDRLDEVTTHASATSTSAAPSKDVELPKPSPQKFKRVDNRFDPDPPPRVMIQKMPKIKGLSHPVFWVEVLDPGYQRWTAVDALITNTIGKPSLLEPPIQYQDNLLSYVVAFDEHGFATDVTRRYAKAYNAKTRRTRVEGVEGSTGWFKRAMKLFTKLRRSERDQLEQTELSAKEAQEPMPRNYQDFIGHPNYVLERHLKKNQVIFPRHSVGRANCGNSAKPRMETVYSRRDVHIVRSADKWFRFGRELKPNERPLKHTVPTRRNPVDTEPLTPVGLYAAYQTTPYIPPPVINGRVPKNAFGNIDLYVPSMLPRGGAHIPHPDAKIAARILDIHWADAVTGFKFKGRQGTAVAEGVVVAAEYREAVEAVLEGLEYMRVLELEEFRREEALRMWRRFIVGLRIVERAKGYVEDDGSQDKNEDEEMADVTETSSKENEAATADNDAQPITQLDVPRPNNRRSDGTGFEGGLFGGAEPIPRIVYSSTRKQFYRLHYLPRDEEAETTANERERTTTSPLSDSLDDLFEDDGSFLPEEEPADSGPPDRNMEDIFDDGGGGGFLPESEDAMSSPDGDDDGGPLRPSRARHPVRCVDADVDTEESAGPNIARNPSPYDQFEQDAQETSLEEQEVEGSVWRTKRPAAWSSSSENIKRNDHGEYDDLLSEDPDEEEMEWVDDFIA